MSKRSKFTMFSGRFLFSGLTGYIRPVGIVSGVAAFQIGTGDHWITVYDHRLEAIELMTRYDAANEDYLEASDDYDSEMSESYASSIGCSWAFDYGHCASASTSRWLSQASQTEELLRKDVQAFYSSRFEARCKVRQRTRYGRKETYVVIAKSDYENVRDYSPYITREPEFEITVIENKCGWNQHPVVIKSRKGVTNLN